MARKKSGSYELIDDVYLAPHGNRVWRAKGPRGMAAVIELSPTSRLRPRKDLTVTIHGSASPCFYAVEVSGGPRLPRAFDRALLQAWRTFEFLDRAVSDGLLSLDFLRHHRPQGWRLVRHRARIHYRRLRIRASSRFRAASAQLGNGAKKLAKAWPVLSMVAALGTFLGVVALLAITLVERHGGHPFDTATIATGAEGSLALGERRLPLWDWQARPPCVSWAQELDGGCWVQIPAKPPCPQNTSAPTWQKDGKCWIPLGKQEGSPEPRAKDGSHPSPPPTTNESR